MPQTLYVRRLLLRSRHPLAAGQNHFFNRSGLNFRGRGLVLRSATIIAAGFFQMPFTIRASKDGETIETVRIGPTATVAKARGLFKTGWIVQIIDDNGLPYAPSDGVLPDWLISGGESGAGNRASPR